MWRFILREDIRECRSRITQSTSAAERRRLLALLQDREAELEQLVAASSPGLLRNNPVLGVTADRAVKDAMRLAGAQFGNLQVIDGIDGRLRILAQRNFRAPFLTHFASVAEGDGSACARCLEDGGACAVEDVGADPAFAPHLDILRQEGVEAVLSLPLREAPGRRIGVLSVHFNAPRRFTDGDLEVMTRHAHGVSQRLARMLYAGTAATFGS